MNTSCEYGYDTLGRLERGSHNWQEQPGQQRQPIPGQQFEYVFDHVGDQSFWEYAYDDLGQVTSGKHKWRETTFAAGQQFEYTFDAIGNRTETKVGGDAAGTGLRTAAYTPTLLNQYSARAVPGYVDVLGLGVPASAVTVNGATAARDGEYFHHALSVPNSTAQYPTVTVSSGGSSSSGKVFVPPGSESFLHDLDGNLTRDGRWQYTWDAENRLVKMESIAANSGELAKSRRRLEFAYDFMGRRIQKRVTNLYDGSVTEERFLYDGWNLVSVLDAYLALKKSFVWGTDLSGTSQGAGGVGGLLKVNDSTGSYFCAYDGNGNLVGLVNTADGKIAAQYEYGPFGEVIRATGPMARVNPFRWSTQYTDDETDLVCYLHRYYNPSTGRWFSRDPIEEQGGLNLYGFVNNDPVDFVDVFGLWKSRPWGSQHKDLTINALNTALASLRDKPNDKCKSKMADILVEANEGQDSGEGYSDFSRHFNREYFKGETPQQVQQRRTAARDAYTAYLAGEEVSFNYIPECWERLKALGRLSHSWQDFYAHGIHTSRGFVDPMNASPSSPGEFWPSSYNSWRGWGEGEHPNRGEPVEVSSQRYNQAEAYTALRFRRMLENWMASCKCLCQ